MKLERIRGRLPLQKFTGSKYNISLLLSFESQSEKETMYKKAGLPLDREVKVFGAMFLDVDDNLMQDSYVTLQYRTEDGKVHEVNVATTKRWKGALAAVKAYLEQKRNIIYGY